MKSLLLRAFPEDVDVVDVVELVAGVIASDMLHL